MIKKNKPIYYSKNTFNPSIKLAKDTPITQDIVPDLIITPEPPTHILKTKKTIYNNSFLKNLVGVETDDLIEPQLRDKYLVGGFTDSEILKDYTNSYTDSIRIMSGKEVNIKDNISYKKKKFLVLSLIKDCSRSINYIKRFILELSNNSLKTNFYFFSNNNKDNSEKILNQWIKNDNTIYGIFGPEEVITLKNRIIKLSEYRDLALSKALDHFGEDFDYIIVFDSDISEIINLQGVLDSISKANSLEPWSVVSSNSCFNKSDYYYDVFALRLLGQSNDITDSHPDFFKHFGNTHHWMSSLYIFNKGMVEVDSCFGGISIYKAPEIINILKIHKEAYSLQGLPKDTCEHISLCNKLPNKKYIDSDLKYFHNSSLDGGLVQNPMVFIPRDAGFFSVFNFYIGALLSGTKIYPYYNQDTFLKMNNNINEHFAYWTDRDNCWFDYFDPIKFHDDDATHMSPKTLMSLNITNGVGLTPRVFSHPEMTRALINDPEAFYKWRKYTNSFYNKYIKFNSDIIKQVDSFWSDNRLTEKTIGVHYRHPSHSIESGQLYLKQYFDEIDKRLEENSISDIFLASDNEFGILAFKQRYKNKIKYIENVKRTDLDNFLAWSFSLANKKAEIDIVGFIDGKGLELHHTTDKKANNKKMTQDLLKEVICLSRCCSLVCSQSNISFALGYMNPELEIVFLKQENKA